MGDDSYAAALREQIAQAVNDVRETTPLAQSFTNFVTMNLVAKAQLAAGRATGNRLQTAQERQDVGT